MAPLLPPLEATGATRGQYLALSKACKFCYTITVELVWCVCCVCYYQVSLYRSACFSVAMSWRRQCVTSTRSFQFVTILTWCCWMTMIVDISNNM